jgi:hypothetical protein
VPDDDIILLGVGDDDMWRNSSFDDDNSGYGG